MKKTLPLRNRTIAELAAAGEFVLEREKLCVRTLTITNPRTGQPVGYLTVEQARLAGEWAKGVE